VSVPTVNVIRRIYQRPVRNFVYSLLRALAILVRGLRGSRYGVLREAADVLMPESVKRLLAGGKGRYYHFTEYRYTRSELENFLRQSGFEVVETRPHDFLGSRDHSIGLCLDFPFLRSFGRDANFKLNPIGKLVSLVLNGISPWIACSSVICAGRSLKGRY
jgi:hypothetical protein